MDKARFTLPAAVFLLLIEQNKVLLMCRQNTGWHDGDFDLVAGHIDGQESLTTALTREAKEEMDIAISPEDVEFAHLIHAQFEDGKEYFNIFFTVRSWSGTPHNMEPEKCSGFQWFELSDLPENLTPSAKKGLTAFTNHLQYQEFGFDQHVPK
jgi:8-oxo-dGTP diphosphatase